MMSYLTCPSEYHGKYEKRAECPLAVAGQGISPTDDSGEFLGGGGMFDLSRAWGTVSQSTTTGHAKNMGVNRPSTVFLQK